MQTVIICALLIAVALADKQEDTVIEENSQQLEAFEQQEFASEQQEFAFEQQDIAFEQQDAAFTSQNQEMNSVQMQDVSSEKQAIASIQMQEVSSDKPEIASDQPAQIKAVAKKPFSDDEFHSISQDELLTGRKFNRSFPARKRRASRSMKRGRLGRKKSLVRANSIPSTKRAESAPISRPHKYSKTPSRKSNGFRSATERAPPHKPNKAAVSAPSIKSGEYGSIIIANDVPIPRQYYNTYKPEPLPNIPTLFDAKDLEYAQQAINELEKKDTRFGFPTDLNLQPIQVPALKSGEIASAQDIDERQYEHGFGKGRFASMERQAKIRELAEKHRLDQMKRSIADRGIWQTINRRQ